MWAWIYTWLRVLEKGMLGMSRRVDTITPSLPLPMLHSGQESWVLAVIHMGPPDGFKLMIVLIRFAFEKELLGPGLGAEDRGRLGPPQALSSAAPHWSWPPEQRGHWLNTQATGRLRFSSPIRLSIASARQNTKCAHEITALRAEGQSWILGSETCRLRFFPSKCRTWF